MKGPISQVVLQTLKNTFMYFFMKGGIDGFFFSLSSVPSTSFQLVP